MGISRARIFWGTVLMALTVPFVQPTLAHAEDPDIVIVGWFDHFTYGAINTLIGVPTALTGIIVNAIRSGEAPRFSIDETGQQIKVSTGSVNGFDYSTGAFHHGSCCDAHEAAHGKQSAVLGPAFLPMVGVSYLVQGLDIGVMEDWADAWRDLGSTMVNRHPMKLDFEVRDRDGKVTEHVGMSVVVMERSSRVNAGGQHSEDNPVEVAYQYGKIGVYVMLPTQSEPGDAPLPSGTSNKQIFPVHVQATALEKDFNARWTVVGGIFSILSDSKEVTGMLDWDFADQRVQAKILSQTLGMGVRVGDESKIALDVMGRAMASVEGVWFTGTDANGNSPGMMLTAGVGAEARLHILQYLEIFAKKSREWSLVGNKYRRDIEAVGAESPYFFTKHSFTYKNRKDRGAPVSLYGGMKFVHEVETMPDSTGVDRARDIKSFFFTFGGRW